LRSGNQTLLAAVRQDVPEAINLSRLFLADHDRLVSAAPELLPPAMQSTGLPRQVRVEVVHEAGELKGVLHTEKKVVVIGKEDEGMHVN
jgi:hypothetical protein